MFGFLSWAAYLLALPLIAVDAGHGGTQGGACGICGIEEKDVTLALALRTAARLEASGLAHVYLVRRDDTTLSLQERSSAANARQASLFVSIHANASVDPHVRGVETFFLSRRSESRWVQHVAFRENDGVPMAAPNPPDPLQHILQGLSLDAAHADSQRLALRLQQTLQRHLHSGGRGVLQAPFVVLADAQMAAVLVEVGFMTHPTECRRLASAAYQDLIAEALTAGILGHIRQRRGTDTVATNALSRKP